MSSCDKCLGTGHPNDPNDPCCTMCGGTGEHYAPGDAVAVPGGIVGVIQRVTQRHHEAEIIFLPSGHMGRYSVHHLTRTVRP